MVDVLHHGTAFEPVFSRRGEKWMLPNSSHFEGIENLTYFYCIIPTVICVILFLHWQLDRTKDAKQILKENAHEVHHIAGNLCPQTESVVRCIKILNQFPYFINHPRPPYNYTPFLRACWSGNATLVRYMLLHGADINSYTVCRETPIYLATYRVLKRRVWNPSVLNLLYEAGCPLSVPNEKGLTALHCAVHAGHVTLTRWLLMHGAHKTLPRSKATPYDYAVRFHDENHKSIAILLQLYCPEMAVKNIKKNCVCNSQQQMIDSFLRRCNRQI